MRLGMRSVRFQNWRRWLYRRVIRLQGTSHSIAWGMALGVFFGFLMPPGLQLVTGIPVALLLGGNVVTLVAGTLVTNPFTYVPAYYFTCRVGEAFLHFCGSDVALGANFRQMLQTAIHLNLGALVEKLGPIVLCWIAGGIIVGLAGAVPAYYFTYFVVIEIHKLRIFSIERRARRKAERLAADSAPDATAPEEPEQKTEESVPPAGP